MQIIDSQWHALTVSGLFSLQYVDFSQCLLYMSVLNLIYGFRKFHLHTIANTEAVQIHHEQFYYRTTMINCNNMKCVCTLLFEALYVEI